MRLFLKVICVEPPQLLEKTVDPRDVVRDVLYRVQCGEPAEALALVYEGRELPIAQTLEAAGVQDGATVHVICIRRTVRLHAKAQVAELTGALTRSLVPMTRQRTLGDALAGHLNTQQLMDLVFTVGQYNLVSMVLNSFGVQLDEGLPGWDV